MKNYFNILVIDDIFKTTQLLKDLFTYHNDIKVYTATNGEEGLKIIFHNPINLLITDINMPNVNGFDIVEFLSKNKVTKQIPVIFFTASSNDNDEIHAYKLGALDYIQKNTDPEIIDLKLGQHIKTLSKEKKLQNLFQKNQELTIQQSRMATIGELINSIVFTWKQTIDNIVLTNSGLRYKIATNNFDTSLIDQKLNKVDIYIKNLSNDINFITDFSIDEKEKSNTVLSDLLDKALSILQPIINFHNIRIETKYKVYKGINIYSNDILQIFLIIIKNSIDTIIKKNPVKPKISIQVREEKWLQTVQISDNTGKGDINHTELQASTLNIENYKNSNINLGLLISETILNKHAKGKIYINNTDFGITYTLKINDIE